MARGIDTKCIHLEEDEGQCSHYGALSYPIYQTATYAHPGVGQSTGFDYSRLQNPTREHLEKMVAVLENGIDAFALSSVMAAISLLMERATTSLRTPICTAVAFVCSTTSTRKTASSFPASTAAVMMWRAM